MELLLREQESVGRRGFVSIVGRNLLIHQQKVGYSVQSAWSVVPCTKDVV